MKKPTSPSVTLDEPLKRGEETISTLSLRKPSSGELRGLSLVELLNLQVDPLHKLLPRITTPAISEAEARSLAPSDLVQLGTEIVGFLAPKSLKEEFPTT